MQGRGASLPAGSKASFGEVEMKGGGMRGWLLGGEAGYEDIKGGEAEQ